LRIGFFFADSKTRVCVRVFVVCIHTPVNVMFSFFVEGVLFKSMPCPITNRLFYDSILEKKSNFEFHLY